MTTPLPLPLDTDITAGDAGHIAAHDSLAYYVNQLSSDGGGGGGLGNVVTGAQADTAGTSITSTVAGSGSSSAGPDSAVAVGDANALGSASIAVGVAAGVDSGASQGVSIGPYSHVSGMFGTALGPAGVHATGNGTVAIGTDSTGVAAQATGDNDFVLGTASHHVRVAGELHTAASSSTKAGLNVAPGTAPSAPVNGDIWVTSAGMFVRVGGVTKQVTLT
jgi:hypothetical protein